MKNNGLLKSVVLQETCLTCGQHLVAFPGDPVPHPWWKVCDNGLCAAFRHPGYVSKQTMKVDDVLTDQYRKAIDGKILDLNGVSIHHGVFPMVITNSKQATSV
jgi:hypothetical protein